MITKRKPGPSRKLPPLEEILLVLMRLKAGLFVQDLADRFGISISSVSRIYITWINFLYYELKDLFPFPSQELVRKNMPKEFAQYPTTRIILDCTELFIQRPPLCWPDHKHGQTINTTIMEIACWRYSKWSSDLLISTLGWSCI